MLKRYDLQSGLAVMTRDEVRGVDSWAINELGIPGVVLMENAGRTCAEFLIDKLKGKPNANVAVFCGSGNNGGDGYVIARHLANAGIDVTVVICCDPEKIDGDARINFEIIRKMGLHIGVLDLTADSVPSKVQTLCGGAEIVVDALFGTGLSGELRPRYQVLINTINGCEKPVLAVDIPSGLDCDEGNVLGACIKAAWTISFVAVKQGFTAQSAAEYTGEVYVASIGIEPSER